MNAASLHFLFTALAPRLRELADADEGGECFCEIGYECLECGRARVARRRENEEDDDTVTCPGCWSEVPADQLCDHDDTNTGPLCLARCCEIEHQVSYRRWIPDGAA